MNDPAVYARSAPITFIKNVKKLRPWSWSANAMASVPCRSRASSGMLLNFQTCPPNSWFPPMKDITSAALNTGATLSSAWWDGFDQYLK